jgi:hypothetical protein
MPAIDTIVARLFPLSADWLPVVNFCGGHPSDRDMVYIVA